MQNSTTILGIIEMRLKGISYDDCRNRYGVGNSTVNLIMSRYRAKGIPLEVLKQMPGSEVEASFYPPSNVRRKSEDIMPDYEAILSTGDYELCSKLKAMRFSGMAEALEELLRDPNSDLIPFREKVGRLVDAEWDLRYNKKLNRFIKKATLKYPHADLDETIYDPERLLDTRIIEELTKCKWVEEGRNLMVTGQTGSGKSYLANALAICALRQFKTVKYCKASHLIDELNRAEAMDNHRETLANLVSFDLLVIDDFGLMQLDLNKCRNLFEVLESRDPGRSTMVISQFPVNAWYDLFQEHTYADACLNRLLHNSYRLEMNGKNMRDLTPLNR